MDGFTANNNFGSDLHHREQYFILFRRQTTMVALWSYYLRTGQPDPTTDSMWGSVSDGVDNCEYIVCQSIKPSSIVNIIISGPIIGFKHTNHNCKLNFYDELNSIAWAIPHCSQLKRHVWHLIKLLSSEQVSCHVEGVNYVDDETDL